MTAVLREAVDIPRRSLVRGDADDAEALFTRPWLPNNGYWKDDGYKYQSCHRCGINMKMKLSKKRGGPNTYDKTEHRVFCKDCNHPVLLRSFNQVQDRG